VAIESQSVDWGMRPKSANQSVERMAAGGRRLRIRAPWAAAIAHFSRWAMNTIIQTAALRCCIAALALVSSGPVRASRIGPETVRECPYCSTHLSQPTFLSFNLYPEQEWTDGFAIGVPDRTQLLKCPGCGNLLWIDEAKELGRQAISGENRPWPKSTLPDRPSADEILAYVAKEDLSREKEIHARVRAWWSANERVRNRPEAEQRFTAAEVTNLERLASVLDETNTDQCLMKAEIWRELGRFDDCALLLKCPFDKPKKPLADLIRTLAEEKCATVQEVPRQRPPNHSVETNRRPAAPLESGSQLGSPISARTACPAPLAYVSR